MKVMGIIGGMSWESTQTYYQMMNQSIRRKKGGLYSIEAILYSVNLQEIEEMLIQNDWESITNLTVELAEKIESIGAQFLIMTSNAIHKIADEVEKNIRIPLLHILDPTAKAIAQAQLKKVGLIGTKVVMGEKFFKERLEKQYGLTIFVPQTEDQIDLHKIIFEELLVGKVSQKSKSKVEAILQNLEKQGAEGLILGCTELNLLVKQRDTSLQLFDTTSLHAEAAVNFSLS